MRKADLSPGIVYRLGGISGWGEPALLVDFLHDRCSDGGGGGWGQRTTGFVRSNRDGRVHTGYTGVVSTGYLVAKVYASGRDRREREWLADNVGAAAAAIKAARVDGVYPASVEVDGHRLDLTLCNNVNLRETWADHLARVAAEREASAAASERDAAIYARRSADARHAVALLAVLGLTGRAIEKDGTVLLNAAHVIEVMTA